MDREERIQRQMDFIIEQQAQFSVDNGKLQESIEKIESVVLRFANATVERFEQDEEKITLLLESQLETDQKIKELAESQKNLTELQKTTDERLNAVIYMFEKFISRDINGNSES